MSDDRPIPASAVVLQLSMCAIWGFGQIAVKIGNTGISPVFQATLRSLAGLALVLAWVAWRRIPMRARDGAMPAGIAAGVLFALEFVFLYIGINMTTAARGTLLIYTAPFFVALGAHWFVPNDRLTRNKSIGLVLAFAGVVVAFADRLSMPDPHALLGDFLCLLAGICWAATTVVIKATKMRSIGPEKALVYQLVVSIPVLALTALALGERGVFAGSTAVWLAFAYQAVMVVGVSYLLWFWLISRYRATALSVFTFLTPVLGVLFAWLLLGEQVSVSLLLALALIAVGIVLVNRG